MNNLLEAAYFQKTVLISNPQHLLEVFICGDAGREAHVMTFEVGAALEDAKWQVPWYCFEETNNATTSMPDVSGAITQRSLVDFGTRKVQDM